MRAFVLLGFGLAYGAAAAPMAGPHPAEWGLKAGATGLPVAGRTAPAGVGAPVAKAGARGSPTSKPKPEMSRPRPDPSALRDAQQAAARSRDLSSSAAYAHFLNARLKHAAGDDRASLDELRLALASDPGNRYLLASVGEAHARLGEHDLARRELEKLVQRDPDDGRAHLLLGRVLHESGRSTRAAQHLSRAVALRPTEPDPYLALIQLHLDRNDAAGAERLANALADAVPGETVAQRRLGEVLAETGDPKRAERLLRRVLAHDPADADAWLIVAGITEADGRLEVSEAALEQALAHLEDPSEVLFARGRLALRREDRKAARAHFARLFDAGAPSELRIRVALQWLGQGVPKEAVVALRPGDATLREGRLSFFAGLLLIRLRDFDAAASAFAEAEGDPGLAAEARRERASALSRAGRHAPALELLSAAARGVPEAPEDRVAWSLALERAGRVEEAEAVLRAQGPRGADPMVVALAALLQRTGRGSEALGLLEASLGEDPEASEVRRALGLAYVRGGRGKEALALIRESGRDWPDHAPTLNFAGYLMAEAGLHLDEAERLIRRALVLRPNTGAYLDSLGVVLLRRGRVSAALEALQEAAGLEPFEPVILDHLGEALRRAGRTSEARRHWQRALELGVGPDVDVPPGFREAVRGKLEALSERRGSR